MSHEHDAPSFRLLLRRFRQAAGLTQEALAERAHLSARAISDLERGLNLRPRQDTLTLLAEALALAPADYATLEAAARRPIAPLPAHDTHSSPTTALPVLVGRMQELALLERHLGGPGPPLLVLAGEPGIGKSRLLAEVAGRGDAGGWAVLAGGCQRRGGQEPYAPLLEALERHIQGQAPEQRRVVLRGCAWLVRLLPELSSEPIEPLPAWTVPPEQERRLVFKAVSRYLANVAGPAGTLLVLDDLQWAGADALELLATLVRAPAGVPLRVVGAYRDTEAPQDAPLSVTLADLAQAGLALHHALAPLTALEVGLLLDQLVAGIEDAGDALREQMAQRTGGVPFFVVSCVQAIHLVDGAWQDSGAVPWTVAQSVRQRMTALSATAQEVLGIAGVLGREIQPTLLAAVATKSEDDVIGALEAAQRLRLLEEHRGVYRFAHDLVREVVEGNVGLARQLVLHRRAGEALEALAGEPPVALLAYHYSRSDAQDKAIFYLERAGDQALARYAHASAVAHYQELSERLNAVGQPAEASRVREKLGAALRRMGCFDAALATLDRAAETWRALGNLEGLRRAMTQIGWVYVATGATGEGIQRLQDVLPLLEEQGPSMSLVAFYDALAYLLFVAGRYVEYLTATERTTTMARLLGDSRMVFSAEVQRGNALQMLGHVEDALRVTEGALALCPESDDLIVLSGAYNGKAYIHLFRGEFDISLRYSQQAFDLVERVGDPVFVIFLDAARNLLPIFLGEWTQVREAMGPSTAISRQLGESWASAYALTVLGKVSLVQGQWGEAARILEEAVNHAARIGDFQALRWAASALAELAVQEGRPDAAKARLLPLLDRPGLEEFDVTGFLPVLAWAYLELGESINAAETIAAAIRRARAGQLRLMLTDALRVQALVAARQGRLTEAISALDEGLALAGALPYPYAEGRLLQLYGTLPAEHADAQGRLAAALAIFRRLGAQKDLEWTEQLLTKLDWDVAPYALTDG